MRLEMLVLWCGPQTNQNMGNTFLVFLVHCEIVVRGRDVNVWKLIVLVSHP